MKKNEEAHWQRQGDMMKLYMKQKVFSWTDRFMVKNEDGADAFSVQGEFFSFGKKLHVYDKSEREVAYIEQKVFAFMPRYYIHIANETYEMVKEFTFFRSRYRLENLPWEMEGHFMSHDFHLEDTRSSQTLMRVYKEWFTWGDSYALDIADAQNALLCLCMVLVVDCVLANSNNN